MEPIVITDELLQAARLGADWAWTAVYRELSPAVLRYLRANGGGDHCEDILGEVFVQIVRKHADFSGSAADFRSWVFVIAHNKMVDHWRRQANDRSAPVADDALIDVPAVDCVESDALGSVTEGDVRQILDRLPVDQRNVLLLRFIADLSLTETARVLGKREGAVKSLQLRALRAIRREMSREPVTRQAPATFTKTRREVTRT